MNRTLSIPFPISLKSGASDLPLAKGLLIWLLCFLPLFFGGTHPHVYLAMYAVSFFYLASFFSPLEPGVSKKILSTLSLLCVYLLAFGIFRLLSSQPHPVLLSVSSLFSAERYFITWFGIASAVSVFCLTVIFLREGRLSVEFLLRTISFSGFMVSLIALSHWFYDNGRLFWIFEPEHLFLSERARWPYVSSNNLGHHLVLTLYPALYLLIRGIRSLFRTVDTIAARRPIYALDLINTPGVQFKLLRIVFDLFTLLSIALALLASQSRGSWFGSCIGVILFLLVDRALHGGRSPQPARQSGETDARSRKKKGRSIEGATFFDTFIFMVRKLSFLAGMLTALVLLMLFLRDRGLDLVTNRAEYGLLASKDDIRWVMYHNTLPLIMQHPLVGVGLGGWNIAVGSYIDPSLARLNPVYLHSDPLQFLAETGLAGCSFLLYAAFLLVRAAAKTVIGDPDKKEGQASLALLCSIFALVVSSFFDFPFRIPSLSYLFMVELAALCFISDSALLNNKTDRVRESTEATKESNIT